jgi:PKD repeat protein
VGAPQGGSTSSHQYLSTGTFTVTVTVTNSAGLSASASNNVSVAAAAPAAALTVTPSGGLVPVSITADASASGTPPGTTVAGYTFNFGDGSAAVGPQAAATATHVFTIVGRFSVSVIVTDSARQSSSAAIAVTVTGVTMSQQVRSGVINGPPNNQLETDVNWADPVTGDGWQVGMVPGYGGAIVSFWSQIDAGVVKPSQTSLNTTTPAGLFHDLTNRNFVYRGSEDGPFNVQELAPVGTAFRRAYLASIPRTGKDANGFQHSVTTYIYPGDPGFLIQRYDLINPSTSAITLSSSDSIELAFIGGLQQVDTTWRPGNGKYGFVGGSAGTWPATETSGEPDYYYINPAAGSATQLGLLAVRKTSLTGLGLTNPKFLYMQNNHRLKIKTQGNLAAFPASTTFTFYLIQVLRRNLTASDGASIAADYLHPDSPAMISGSFSGFSYDEGAYQFTSANGFTLQFSPALVAPVTTRWIDVYKIAGWNGSLPIRVTVGSTALQPGVDYISLIDPASHVAYVKLMKPLVASPGGANQLAIGTVTISG